MGETLTGASPSIFLHSGFRSGSTWFWNRFREAAGTCAYYEPLHEGKAVMTAATIGADRPDSQIWKSGHPSLRFPYNVEYLELLRPEGGVRSYHERFAYDGYYAPEDDALRRYVDALEEHARAAGRKAVFGFKRSLGRLASLRANHRGLHVVTLRDPWDQWCSLANQTARGNLYFSLRFCLIAAIGRYASAYGDFFDGLFLLEPAGASLYEKVAFVRPFLVAMPQQQMFRLFLRVVLLDYLLALPEADLLIDLDRLSAEVDYRAATVASLREAAGLADLRFEDCALPSHPVSVDPAYRAALEEALILLDRQRLAPAWAAAVIRDKLETSLSPFLHRTLTGA